MARHGGAEVGTEGDSFLVAFSRPRDALLAALDAQRGLASHTWPGDAELRVRMGIHIGDATVVDGGYVSFALHQAARVVSTGHGGQVVVSEQAAAMLEAGLPPGATLVDLGLYDLRDFESPERLFQLAHPDLLSSFPPLRAPSTEEGDDPAAPLPLADEAMSVGDLDAAVAHLSAAAQGLTAAGRNREAAMVCTRLGDLFANMMTNKVAARPWFTRAMRLVEHEEPCVEQGWAAVAAMGCDVDDPALLLDRAELALDRARRFGDVNLETKALADGGLARVQAGQVSEGMAMIDEAMALACGSADDPYTAGKSVCSFFTACYVTADFDRVETWSRVLRQRGILGAVPGPQAYLNSHCDSVQGTLLCHLGRWGEAEDLLTRALVTLEELMPGVGWYPPIALAELRILQGRLTEAEALLLGRDDHMHALLPTARLHLARSDYDLACATARRGLRLLGDDRVRAAALLGVVVEAELGRGDLAEATRASAELDARTAGLELPALRAEGARLRARVLSVRGDAETAAAALQQGLDELTGAGLPRLRASLHLALARLREETGDRAEAVVEARTAAAMLAHLDVTIAPDDVALLQRLGIAEPSVAPHAGCRVATLVRDGSWWTAGCDNATVRLRDTKGMRYLAELVANPGAERHVLELVDMDDIPNPDERLDDQGRAASRRRIAALRDDVEDALAAEDHERAATRKAELDAVVDELARSFGVGPGAQASTEKARRNVTRALRAAVARLVEALPDAGGVLDRRVRMGPFASYQPHPDDEVLWTVQGGD
jgi:tetratricopeptide (TPR) repeat protein